MPALNIPQARFMQMPNKFRAFVSGFGGGKTWVGCSAMSAHFWSNPKVNQGYFAPTYPQIRDIFFPTIEEVAYGLGLRVDIMEANKEVHFYSGRQYRGTTICRSMERPHTIIGFKIGRALIDEFDVLDPKKADQAWKKIIGRLRWADCQNGADITTTPEGFRTTYKLFVKAVADNPALAKSYGLIQASTRDNAKNLPDGYIESLLEAYPKELISAYIDGRFVNLTSGSVYTSFDRERCHSDRVVVDGEPLFIGMDFNVNNMAAIVFVGDSVGTVATDELIGYADTPAIIRAIKERYPDNPVVNVYPDASGQNTSSKGASLSDISLLKSAGFMVRANSHNPRVRDRIICVNKRLEDGTVKINTARCKQLTEALERQAYDKNGEPDKSGGYDHPVDALGYRVHYSFPIRSPRDNGPIWYK